MKTIDVRGYQLYENGGITTFTKDNTVPIHRTEAQIYEMLAKALYDRDHLDDCVRDLQALVTKLV